MTKDFCAGCGHHFPSKEEGMAKCPQCGRPVHLHDQVQCPECGNLSKRGTSFCAECGTALFKLCERCEKRGPVDANFCAECGGRLLDQKAHLARKETEQEELDRQARRTASRRALVSLLIVAALLAGAWFFCVAPTVQWFKREGVTWDTMVPTAAPRLSQAQIEATRQTEIAQRIAAFGVDEILVSLGDVVDKKRTYGEEYYDNLHTYVEVTVENRSGSFHHVILAYDFGEDIQYQDLEIQPHSAVSFVAEHVARLNWDFIDGGFDQGPYNWDGVFFLARVESLDDLNRENVPQMPEWDWALRFVKFGSVSDYPCDYGDCRQDDP